MSFARLSYVNTRSFYEGPSKVSTRSIYRDSKVLIKHATLGTSLRIYTEIWKLRYIFAVWRSETSISQRISSLAGSSYLWQNNFPSRAYGRVSSRYLCIFTVKIRNSSVKLNVSNQCELHCGINTCDEREYFRMCIKWYNYWKFN